MERSQSEQMRIYWSMIDNLEALKRQEGMTDAELYALSDIQENLSKLARGTESFQPNSSSVFGLGFAF